MDLKEEKKIEESKQGSDMSVVNVFLLSQVVSIIAIGGQALFKDVQVSHGVSLAEISLVRNSTSLFLSTIVLVIYGNNPLKTVEQEHIIPLAVKSSLGCIAFIIGIYVIKLVPLTIF